MIFIIIPLLSWIGLSFAFFDMSLMIYPSNEDVSEAYDLTSWISNQTSREILREYITICPWQDHCHGGVFIRKYVPEFDMVSACTPCDCDDSCVRKSTCCPSKFLRIEKSPDTNGETQQNHNLKKPPLACVQPFWKTFTGSDAQGYWIIKSCLNGDPCDQHKTDLNSSTPVTSIVTNETYLNEECAVCNNENALNLIFWKQNQVLCQDRASLLQQKTPENLIKMASQSRLKCNILFYPPGTVADMLKQCLAVAIHVNSCNFTGTLTNERAYLIRACDSYHLPYSNCFTTFKNAFCALCNQESVSQLPIQCSKDVVGYTGNQFPMFSALMDFNKDKEIDVASHDRSCEAGQMHDKRMNECLDVTCEAEYVLEQNLECRPMYPEWGENNYEVNMIFRPTHEVNEVQSNEMSFYLKEYLENRMTQHDVAKYLCLIHIFEVVENGVMYFGGLIELTVDHRHDIDEMIDKFTQIFSIDHDITLVDIFFGFDMNVSSSIIGQRFHLYENSRQFSSVYNRQYIHPMLFQSIHPSIASAISDVRPFCSKLPSAIVVTEWYRCPKVKITTADTKIDVKNYSLCLVDHSHCIPSRYFKRSFNNLQFDVCVDWYFLSSARVSSHLTSSDDMVNIYLSLVCLSLSSVGSLMTILSYLIKKERANSPEINVLILSVFLIIANTIYTFSVFFQWNETLCVIVGMLVHFFWLSVVFWMSLCSFDVFETFTNFAVLKLKQTSKICFRLIINLLLCLTLVGTNIIVSQIVSDGQSFGYSSRTCYIEQSKMILYTFTLPVGVTVCINTFMFIVTVSRIHDKGDMRKSKDQEKVSAYFRLSTLTGMSWLFGFLAQFTNLQAFSFLHTVFSAGQGIFLYLAFGRQEGSSCKCVKDDALEK